MDRERNESGSAPDLGRLAETLALIGDKWTIKVIGAVSDGPSRFNAVRRSVDGISHRMLTLTLRGLERNGLIARTIYPPVPPKVEYQLTRLGRSLIGPLRPLADWSARNRQAISDARTHFDLQRTN